MSVGSFFGGILFDNIGGSATFRYFAGGALVFLVVHVIVQNVYERSRLLKERILAISGK